MTTRQAAAHFLPAFADRSESRELEERIQSLWLGDRCEVHQCALCEGCYSVPFVAGDAEFYRLAYAHNYGYPQSRWEFVQSIQTMGDVREMRVLEIGSGDGAFLKQLLKAGVKPSNLCSIEYSEEGRSKISKLSSDIRILPDAKVLLHGELKGTFDAICAFQVMEHVGEPAKYFARFSELLSTGGRAFISVPNPSRIEFNESHGALLDMPPNHILRFAERGVSELAKRSGLKLERLLDEPFSQKAAAMQYLQYWYRRQAQIPSTLPHLAESFLRAKPIRKLAAATIIAAALPVLVPRLRGRTDGGTRWFVLAPQCH